MKEEFFVWQDFIKGGMIFIVVFFCVLLVCIGLLVKLDLLQGLLSCEVFERYIFKFQKECEWINQVVSCSLDNLLIKIK